MCAALAVAYLATQLGGALTVFASNLRMFVRLAGRLSAEPLPDENGVSMSTPMATGVSDDVLTDMLCCIRAALFFAVQDLQVRLC